MATKTTLHDLYPDILLCIFDYFTIHEVYEIFSESIPYLTSLLVNSHIQLHLRKPIFTYVNPAQITSIHLARLPRISLPSMSDFTNLRSLILDDMEDPQMLVNPSLSCSLEILHLNISLRNKPDIVLRLLTLLIQLPKLTSYTLIYPSSYFIVQEDSLIHLRTSNTIKRIKLDVKCEINYLEKLLQYLPCLHRLETTIESNPESITTSLFPSVQYLILTWNYIPFQDIITLCKKMPNLKYCEFNATDHRYDQNVFNPDIWRQFIENDHILLDKLIIDMKHQATQYTIAPPRAFSSMSNNPYFRSINFQFETNYWNQLVLVGNYIKHRSNNENYFCFRSQLQIQE